MKYQIIKLENSQRNRLAVIECPNRLAALKKLSAMAKETDSILYLMFYSESRPDWHDSVIATATHAGEIINY